MRHRFYKSDLRDSTRYTLVREGNGPGGIVGEVGTLRYSPMCTGNQERWVIIEFVAMDGHYIIWNRTGEGKHAKLLTYQSQQAAADYAIEEMERTTHYKRCQL